VRRRLRQIWCGLRNYHHFVRDTDLEGLYRCTRCDAIEWQSNEWDGGRSGGGGLGGGG
jgi:hypothetical protein